MIKALINQIEAYCAARGIAESTFGFLAVNDGKFMKRLRTKGDCRTGTYERATKFMHDNPPESAKTSSEGAAA